ncbi:MAG TPA: MFS transporter [Bryobacteraceae bacterium]|nr:MFS transporter [Bryobacteraceae bacterium]
MSARPSWLSRNVAGMCVTSLCADACYEMVLAVLPGFAGTIGVAAAALGWIEGGADALASFVKLGAGWYSDRIGRRHGIVTFGYFLSGTALAVLAAAASWPLILLGRMVAWFGKGIRSPLRDAMLSEAASAGNRGKVFGMHRAADTTGAVLGPLIGVWLLTILPRPDPSAPYRRIFLISLIPGLLAVASMILLVRESPSSARPDLRLWGSLRSLPRAFAGLLGGVGLFGLGDFSHTLLVLAAAQLLTPAHGALRAGQIAALLYALHNAAYAAAAFPAGALADRLGKRTMLAAGCAMGALTAFGIAAIFAARVTSLPLLAALFVWAGLYVGVEKPSESALTADLVPRDSRGSAYGLLGSVNGVGDLAASALVGMLWTSVSPQIAFSAAGMLMLAGAAVLTARQRG